MPIIKNAFSSGKMNKDLDERLVPNGEYRHAMNVQVTTSDGDDAGALQNILGNEKLSNIAGESYNAGQAVVVGAVSDEKSNSVYWLVEHSVYQLTGQSFVRQDVYPKVQKDYIVEYTKTIDPGGGGNSQGYSPVAVDVYNVELISGELEDAQITQPGLGSYGGGVTNLSYNFGTPTQLDSIIPNQTIAPFIEPDSPCGIIFDYSNDLLLKKALHGIHRNMVLTIIDNPTSLAYTYDSEITEVRKLPNNKLLVWLRSKNTTVQSGNLLVDLPFGAEPDTLFQFTSPRVFNFTQDKRVTGINIIDDLLFFTDNNSEPKKINITRFKEGSFNFYEQTKIINDSRDYTVSLYGSNLEMALPPMAQKHVTVIKKSPLSAPNLKMISTAGNNISCFAGPSGNNFDGTNFEEGSTNKVKSRLTEHELVVRNTQDVPLDWQEGDVLLLKSTGTNILSSPSNDFLPVKTDFQIRARIVRFSDTFPNIGGIDQEIFLTIQILSIDGDTPLAQNLFFGVSKEDNDDALFENKFCRFGYRWKYIDGEYSCFSPFSEIAFVPGSFDHHPTKGYNLAMSNTVQELTIQDFITPDMPEDVVEVDLLFKDTSSPNVYVVETLRKNDPIVSGYTSSVSGLGLNSWMDRGSAYYEQQAGNIDLYDLSKCKVEGSYRLKSETIFKVLPSEQMLRPFDNVPQKALAQEVTANRLIYGNYEQNFDLTNHKIKFGDFSAQSYDPVGEQGTLGKKSIKSLREYQVGVVYTDEYGRETPVITDDTGGLKTSKKVASDYNRLRVKIDGAQPDFAKYFKFYIKETSNEYYNLPMDRMYDAKDGNVWISFPSADRNKIDEDTYLILKKGNGVNNFIEQKAKYKVLAIANEAPLFIKQEKRLLGRIQAAPSTVAFPDTETPTSGVGTSPVGTRSFVFRLGGSLTSISENTLTEINENPNVIKFRFVGHPLNTANKSNASKLHEISTITKNEPNTGEFYFHAQLKDIIDPDPGNITITGGAVYDDHFAWESINGLTQGGNTANWSGTSATTGNGLAEDSYTIMEFYEYPEINKPEFDGRFFVKIHADDVILTNFTASEGTDSLETIDAMPLYCLKNDSGNNFNQDVTSFTNGVSTTQSVMDTQSEWAAWINSLHPTIFANNKKYRWFIDETNYYAPARKTGSTYQLDPTNPSPPDLLRGSGTTTTAFNVDNPTPTTARNKGIQNNADYQADMGNNVISFLASGSIDISYAGIDNEEFDLPSHAQNFVDNLKIGNFIQLGGDTDFYKIVAVRRQNFVNYNTSTLFNGFLNGHATSIRAASQRRATFRLHLDNAIGEGPNNTNYANVHQATHAVSESLRVYSPYSRFDDDNKISEDPAVWETEPKEDVGLDIYYEASNEIPINLDVYNDQLFIPIGSEITQHVSMGEVGGVFHDSNFDRPTPADRMYVKRNVNGLLTVSNINDSGTLTLVPGTLLYVTHPISRKVMTVNVTKAPIQATPTTNSGDDNYYFNTESFYVDTNYNGTRELDFSNCFSFGNGVESDRIRDSFNLPTIDNGVRVSTITSEPFEKERRSNGLIFSGLYNGKTGVNNTNQFISANGITKELNTTYGSLQKLFTRDDDVLAFCEDKVLRIYSEKDALFNADGSTNVTKSNKVLGHADPFSGDYGISTNPESFAAESYRCYFTDKQRGAVLRLSRDGITPISDYGMRDYFRDNLKKHPVIIGSYDDVKDEYNLTTRFKLNTETPFIQNTGTTITYNEKNRGWVSFKSFIPDMALSCSGLYYSFNGGEIYEHHFEGMFGPVSGWIPKYNEFYNYKQESSVRFLINEMPTSIKSFKTIVYEGTQSKVSLNLDDNQYHNLEEKKGWYCDNITTDLEEGKAMEFINKEGKWFNYIKGKAHTIDLSSFNFQGLGTPTFSAPPPPQQSLLIQDLNDDD